MRSPFSVCPMHEPVGPSTTVDFYHHVERSREVDHCSQGCMPLDLQVGMHCSRWAVPGSVRICNRRSGWIPEEGRGEVLVMHDSPCARSGDRNCSRRIVCGCRQVTEEEVVRAITTLNLRTLEQVCRHTNAGNGCGCCHKRLSKHLIQRERAVSSRSGDNAPDRRLFNHSIQEHTAMTTIEATPVLGASPGAASNADTDREISDINRS